MIKVEVENLANGRKFGGSFDLMERAEAWIEQQIKKGSWGKPERVLKESEMTEFEKTRVLSKEKDENNEWLCKVRSDIEITIWKEQVYKQNRVKEYPSQMELLEAILENMENRPQKLQAVLARREQVRKNNPKDEKELLEKR